MESHIKYMQTKDDDKAVVMPPAFERLQANKCLMEAHGAVFVENSVDGLDPKDGLAKGGIVRHFNEIDLVSWGSPHVCLPSLKASSEIGGNHVEYKGYVFQTLCAQFPWSIVLMTFAWEQPEMLSEENSVSQRSYHRLRVHLPSTENVYYVPRCSSGEPRCKKDEVHALMAIPKWAEALFAASYYHGMMNHHGAFDLGHFVTAISCRADHAMNLFLGEEAADLSCALALGTV